jgi:hypothetical protein
MRIAADLMILMLTLLPASSMATDYICKPRVFRSCSEDGCRDHDLSSRSSFRVRNDGRDTPIFFVNCPKDVCPSTLEKVKDRAGSVQLAFHHLVDVYVLYAPIGYTRTTQDEAIVHLEFGSCTSVGTEP